MFAIYPPYVGRTLAETAAINILPEHSPFSGSEACAEWRIDDFADPQSGLRLLGQLPEGGELANGVARVVIRALASNNPVRVQLPVGLPLVAAYGSVNHVDPEQCVPQPGDTPLRGMCFSSGDAFLRRVTPEEAQDIIPAVTGLQDAPAWLIFVRDLAVGYVDDKDDLGTRHIGGTPGDEALAIHHLPGGSAVALLQAMYRAG